MPRSVNRTAAYAGIAAGILATGVQVALWWAFTDALPEMLFRDARLAAAIVMGRGVLPPPATFDWSVMLVATLVHFALSVVYGLILAPRLACLDMLQSLLAGAVFGLVLYGVNMYGFTAVFPWFIASRDWITGLTHIAFGVSLAATYKTLSGIGSEFKK